MFLILLFCQVINARSVVYHDTVADIIAGLNYYTLLGVTPSSSDAEIRKKFRELSVVYHPDKNQDDGAADKYLTLNRAYEVLRDVDKRFELDDLLRNGVPYVDQFANLRPQVQVSLLFSVVRQVVCRAAL
jgi:preprotein translocase subunit Sec63